MSSKLLNDNQYEYLLSLIKKIESKIDSHIISNAVNNNDTEITSHQKELNSLSTKFDSISSQFTTIKLKIEKIDELSSFSLKANDLLTTHEIRINNIMKDLSNSKYKYDKIFLDNLIVPGFIGDFCTYKNLKEYLDANIKEMSMLANYKEKTSIDLKQYKDKLEGLIKEFQRQTSLMTSQHQVKCDEVKREAYAYIDNCRDDFYSKYDDFQILNSKYYIDFKEKASQLNTEWLKVLQIKEEINKRFDDTVNHIKADNTKTIDEMKIYSGEFNLIKSKFGELVEFIKDVRFRRNLVTSDNVKKREISQLSNKLKFSNNKSNSNYRRKSVEGAYHPKKLDLKYDFFTGKESISSDDDFSNVANSSSVGNKLKGTPGSLIGNYNFNTFDTNGSVNDNKYKNNNQTITEAPCQFDSNSQIIKANQCNDEVDNGPKTIESPNKINGLNNEKRLINSNATENNFYSSHDNINKLRNQINQTGTTSTVNTNPNLRNLNNNSSTSKIPMNQKKRQSHFNNSLPHQVEGKIVTIHFKENKKGNRFIGFDDREPIDVLFKSNEHEFRKDSSKRFKTVKENTQAINRIFSSSPDNKKQRRQNMAVQNSKDKDKDKNKKDIIDCNNRLKMRYESVDKLLTNLPKILDEEKGSNIQK